MSTNLALKFPLRSEPMICHTCGLHGWGDWYSAYRDYLYWECPKCGNNTMNNQIPYVYPPGHYDY